MEMGVNHLGHFYLTYLLWIKIKAAQKPRIINVSSRGHGYGMIGKINNAIDFEDFQYRNNYDWIKAYSRSKIANILFTRQLQVKMDQAGFQGFAYSLHPGVIVTEMLVDYIKNTGSNFLLYQPFKYLFFKTPWQGAQTTVYTVLED